MNNEEPKRIILDRDEFIRRFGFSADRKTFINVESMYCLACGSKQAIEIDHEKQQITLLEYHYYDCEYKTEVS